MKRYGFACMLFALATGSAIAQPCDLCNAVNGCNYTCVNTANASISPATAMPGEEVVVSLDFEVSGFAGHIFYAGIALDNAYQGTFYSGVPNGTPDVPGAVGTGSTTFPAPSSAGTYHVYVAVAHVYNEPQMIESVANGQADLLPIGTLTVPQYDPSIIDPITDAVSISLALHNGVPGVVYSEDNDAVHYAKQDGISWTRQVIHSGSSQQPELAYDCDGTPHVVYASGGSWDDLQGWHATLTNGNWMYDQFESNYMTQFAFARLSCGKFRLAFNAGSHNGGPLYTRELIDGTWTDRGPTLSPSITDAGRRGLAACADGRTGLLAAYFSGGEIRYWEDTGAGFTSHGVVATFSPTIYLGRAGSIAFENNGRVYVTYGERSSSSGAWSLFLAWHDPGDSLDTWTHAALPGVDLDGVPQVAVYDGKPYVAYGIDRDEASFTYEFALAAYSDGAWEAWSPIDGRVYGLNLPVGLQIDDGGVAHIAYLAAGHGNAGQPRYASVNVFIDCNANGIPDDADIADGVSEDCNENASPDECDITAGTSADCNTNGLPDECESDFDNDGYIDACDPDIDDDGVDNVSDICDFTPPSLPLHLVEEDGSVLGDLDGDCDVDLYDYEIMQERFTGPYR